jgi:DNA primase
VVALAQAGIEYAVATLGTATTPVHVQKLLRQADEIVFCFDGDSAGRRAAWRALENSLAHLADGKQLRFLFLPDGEDPDSFVRKHGKDTFEALVGKSVPLSKFLLDELTGRVDLGTAEGRARCIHEAKPLLKQMPPNALRLQVIRELAEKCRSTPEEVAQLCELAFATARRAASPASRPPQQGIPRRPHASLAEQLLKLLVSHPNCLDRISPEQRSLFDAPEFASVAELVDTFKGRGIATAAVLIEATRESQHAGLYVQAATSGLNEAADDEMAARELADALLKLERQSMEVEFRRLSGGGTRTETERRRFQEVSKRLDELKRATTGSHNSL